MTQPEQERYEIAEVCLLAGKIILQNGGETYRVEDTMIRIAAAFGHPDAQSFVTPTGIIFSMNGDDPATRLVRIADRSTDLHKVTLVNDISRRIGGGELSASAALRQLRDVEQARNAYPGWLQSSRPRSPAAAS